MPYTARVGHLYRVLGKDGVAEIAAWMNQVYDAKREMDNLRRDVREILSEVRALRVILADAGFYRAS